MASAYLNLVNNRGIPCSASSSIAVTTDAVTVNFNPHPYVGRNFSGLIALKVTSSFTSPGTAVPIYFSMNGNSLPLVDLDGTAVTSETWTGTGIHIVFYDRGSNLLQIIK